MEKLLFITQSKLQMDGTQGRGSGVEKKVYNQYRTFQARFDTYLLGYAGNGIGLYHDGRLAVLCTVRIRPLRRFRLYKAASRLVREAELSCCYIRYGFSSRPFLDMLKNIGRAGARIILEFPTFPYDFEFSRSATDGLIKFFDHRYRMKLRDYVEKAASFSEDRQIFGIPCIHIRNGVCVDDIPARKPAAASDRIHLIGVASMENFHGYDRVIAGLAQYYRNGGGRDIVFHLVGDGKELPAYRASVREYRLQDHVIFHGFRSGKELDDLFDLCGLGVGSLGAHRIGIRLLSSLKSREYAARGLPMITSCRIDVFPENGPYLLKVPEDDSPVDMERVAGFCDGIYRKKPACDVVREIRAFAARHCDMSVTMRPVMEAFCNGEKISCDMREWN